MRIRNLIKNSLYWGGLLGSILAIVYAVFIWQFQWGIQVSGTAYLDGQPVVIQKPSNTEYIKFKSINTIISPPHSIVAKGQTLFTMRAQILPNMSILNKYYKQNQYILHSALLNDSNAVFTDPEFIVPITPYEQRIYDIFTIAYKQDVIKIQTRQAEIQKIIDNLRKQSQSADSTESQKADIQSQIAQMIQMQNNVNVDIATYYRLNDMDIKQKLFTDIITKPIWQNIPIKSPINGYLVYADIITENIAEITPLDAPIAVKIYMPMEQLGKTPPPQVEVLYPASKNNPPIRVPAKIDKIDPQDRDANGYTAVIVRLQDPYIYKTQQFIPESQVYIFIPTTKGTPYAYAKKFLKLRF